MDNKLHDKIERFKVKAEIFIKEKTRAFIVDTNNTYHFCYINKIVDEQRILITPFKGINCNIPENMLWVDVIVFDRYKERSVVHE